MGQEREHGLMRAWDQEFRREGCEPQCVVGRSRRTGLVLFRRNPEVPLSHLLALLTDAVEGIKARLAAGGN